MTRGPQSQGSAQGPRIFAKRDLTAKSTTSHPPSPTLLLLRFSVDAEVHAVPLSETLIPEKHANWSPSPPNFGHDPPHACQHHVNPRNPVCHSIRHLYGPRG